MTSRIVASWRLGVLPIVIIVLLPAVSATASASSSIGRQTNTVTANATQTCLSLVAAAYGPTVWTGISAPQNRPTEVIADWGGTTDNPTSGGGPGGTFSKADANTIMTARNNGVKVLGYVWTDYANSDSAYPSATLSEAENQVLAWKTWYGVTDIFLDGATTGTSQGQIGYYSQLYNFIHSLNPGASVWINPGYYPSSSSYLSVADVIVDWENSSLPPSPPSWVLKYPVTRFANIIHSYTGNVSVALAAIRRDHAQYAYVADSDYYSTLPSYWPTELAGVCS